MSENAHELARQLSARAREVCQLLLPQGMERKGEWCVGDLTGSPGNSLRIVLEGDKAGLWRDWAVEGSKGNLFTLWREVKGLTGPATFDAVAQFLGTTTEPIPVRPRIETKPASDVWLRVQATMRPGTEEELDALACLRGIPSTAGLALATQAGTLFFGPVFDEGGDQHSWIITDGSRRNAQARRLDGQPWAGIKAKAKTISGCEAKWPIGIHGLNGHDIALVEGGPDFLAAWHCIAMANAQDRIQPVAMIGASNPMHDEALPELRSKRVWFFQHKDESGSDALNRWRSQAMQHGAASFSVVDVGEGRKDLNDLVATPNADLPTFAVTQGGLEIEPDWAEDVPQALPPPATELTARPFTDFALPKKGDPSILIGKRWLSRGDIAILASTSGMGKSSLSLQAATTWALGRPLFGGFNPHRPLRSLIFQAEDSEGDVAEVRLSLEHAMKLTDEERNAVRDGVLIVTDRIHRGLSFRAELSKHIALHKPDLVWINPLLAFIGGDVNDSTDVGLFLREQLNSLNEPAKFAYIIVHHTAKPPKERKERQWNEVMYEMAGSADLTNAARAILALQATDKEGVFNLIAAKRGARAGLTKLVPGTTNPALKFEQATSMISLRHSTERFTPDGADEMPVIHWERCDEPKLAEKSKGGRPALYDIEDFIDRFPFTAADAVPLSQVWKAIAGSTGISDNGFKKLCFRAKKDGLLAIAERPGYGPCFYRLRLE